MAGEKWILTRAIVDWSNRLVNAMRTVQASEAKTQFLRLLDDVENGETVIITRHGRSIARITPEPQIDREKVRRAFEGMRELRKRVGKLSSEEILSARDEGRA